jgi:hypothetical protein
MKLTKAQQDAFKWFKDHGGDGVFTYGGRLLAQGEIGPHEARTWKALISSKHCEVYRMGKARRLRITEGLDHE